MFGKLIGKLGSGARDQKVAPASRPSGIAPPRRPGTATIPPAASRTIPPGSPPAASQTIPPGSIQVSRSSPVWTFEQDASLRYTDLQNAPRGLVSAIGQVDAAVFQKADATQLGDLKQRVLQTGAVVREEILLTILGQRWHYDLVIEPRKDPAGKVVGVGGLMLDITERKRAEEALLQANDTLESEVRRLGGELAAAQEQSRVATLGRGRAEEEVLRLADTDPLTGLPGRRLFHDRLAMAAVHAQRHRGRMAVLLLGLDGFSTVNEARGRSSGDDLLRAVAAALETTLRQGDTIARVGGDEFKILLPELAADSDMGRVCEKLRAALRGPFTLGSHEIHMTASIGVALYPADGADSETLTQVAREAMRRAKRQGGDSWETHEPSAAGESAQRKEKEGALRRALLAGDLAMLYQPIAQCSNGAVQAAEALLRWRTSAGVLVAAGEFMELAEATGLSVPLGQWALRSACAHARAWRDAGCEDLCVCVNISPRQFRHRDLGRMLRRVLDETGIPAGCLVLEVPEIDLFRDPDFAIDAMLSLKETGARVVIDEFSAAHSSICDVTRYPLDGLKLSRTVVRDMVTDPRLEAVAAATFAMARALGLQTTAVGVENERQLEMLRSWGCDRMQGTLCGAPMSESELRDSICKSDAP